jgi:hypothetical protein
LPIVKGGNVKFLKQEAWFMNWSKEAVNHYKKDKKSRFQNPQYYFKFGIGVPMISSSSITASLIENKLFDQSLCCHNLCCFCSQAIPNIRRHCLAKQVPKHRQTPFFWPWVKSSRFDSS